MAEINVRVDIPPGASREEKTKLRAGAFQQGLSIASADPGFRLRMILGEAWQKHLELVRWVADELQKDDDKAPGLCELALDKAHDPGFVSQALPNSVPTLVGDTQERLLQEAVAELLARDALTYKSTGEIPAIGFDDADHPVG